MWPDRRDAQDGSFGQTTLGQAADDADGGRQHGVDAEVSRSEGSGNDERGNQPQTEAHDARRGDHGPSARNRVQHATGVQPTFPARFGWTLYRRTRTRRE